MTEEIKAQRRQLEELFVEITGTETIKEQQHRTGTEAASRRATTQAEPDDTIDVFTGELVDDGLGDAIGTPGRDDSDPGW